MLEGFEQVDNIKLIRNNIRHIKCEIDSNEVSSMRLAKECYQLLIRMMVEALRGSANLSITGRPSKNRERLYRQGNDPWKSIQKEDIAGCINAWRYSEPIDIPEPEIENQGRASVSDYLLGFYDLLAMVQSPCFMHHYIHSKVISVSDTEMQLLEWLHESIRNEFEHFIPKILLVAFEDCLNASEICLRISIDLLTKSNNIIVLEIEDLKNNLLLVQNSIKTLNEA